ncbi:MAG: ATP-binding protein [Mariprofundus sp.]
MRIRIFISSAQKELTDERMALQILLSTDPFLSEHCVPVLFEEQPAGLQPDSQAYLELLRTCQVYLGIIWKEYGHQVDGLSATHHEYRLARELSLPSLVTIKGPNSLKRADETEAFIQEIKEDGHTYDRFNDTEALQEKVRTRLIRHIKDTYDLEPTSDQEQSAHQTILVASLFERQRLDFLSWDEIDMDIAAQIVAKADERSVDGLTPEHIRRSLWQRGYLWRNDSNHYFATAAGILLMAHDPSVCFAHCRIQIAAHSGTARSAGPLDHIAIRKPLPDAIDAVVTFIRKNTRHPLRVVGLRKIEVDEYPEAALREALVNALAHRDYEDSGRKVTVDIFQDRIEIVSPGRLAGNLTLTKLRNGTARSRSRNPNTAQGLVFLDRMEERGTGIQRMRDAMLDHGLDKPVITIVDDEVVVTLPGPGDDLDRIRVSTESPTGLKASVEAKLNARQKAALEEAILNGSVTSGWICDKQQVTRETAVQDLTSLVELGLLVRVGKGRGTRYEPVT